MTTGIQRPDERLTPAEFAATLPRGFRIGAATAAFQIEGSLRADGRGPSTWDRFQSEPGRILDGSTADRAADSYRRIADDIALLTEGGFDSYRFSVSWPRIQPSGSGPVNAAGLAFYERLVDGLLGAGIRPMLTLYHWDTPLDLQERGGWLDRDTAYRFADYAFAVGEALGDRVDAWVTINEPATVTLNGYGLGSHAPGLANLFDALPAAHHQLLAHGLGVQALRAAGVSGRVGLANVHSPVVAAGRGPADALFAKVFDLLHNRIFADPVLLGHYPKAPLGARGLFRGLSEVDSDDLKIIHQPLDFYGLNYYFPTRIKAGSPKSAATPDGEAEAMKDVPFTLMPWPEYETTGFGWPIAPDCFALSIEQLAARYGDSLPPIEVTELGTSMPDEPDASDRIRDERRIAYLESHLAAGLRSAAQHGVELLSVHIWSLLDNWEWAAGFTQRFGLVHVDFETGERTPKESYRWLQEVLGNREIPGNSSS